MQNAKKIKFGALNAKIIFKPNYPSNFLGTGDDGTAKISIKLV
jgi:hypothetical protein